MKKFIVFMTSIITMMIIVASPMIALKSYAATQSTSVSEMRSKRNITDKSHYIFFNWEETAYKYAHYIRIQDETPKISENNGVYTVTASCDMYSEITDTNGNQNEGYSSYISLIEINTNNSTIRVKEYSYGDWLNCGMLSSSPKTMQYTNIESDLDFLSPKGLDLNVSFTYPMSGEMTRKKTGETGITTTTDGNLMYINNRGANAQFCMAIVPKGESLSFNTWAYTGRENIIGNPTFVYICDEWQSFGVLSSINIADSSASANSIYAPSAWHTVEEGASRTYYLAWESMKLQKNTEYDCVVYGCLNEDMEEMSGFYYDNYNLGSTYTVSGTINDVQEVYRSTFTIKDPATFNPNYKNEHDSSHPWDPDSDNADLFSTGSAYKDENGNVVIKGFKTGTSGLSWETGSSSSSYSGNNLNVNNAFGGFFGFFRNILSFLPNEYTLIIFFGVVGMVAIGIIKAVK